MKLVVFTNECGYLVYYVIDLINCRLRNRYVIPRSSNELNSFVKVSLSNFEVQCNLETRGAIVCNLTDAPLTIQTDSGSYRSLVTRASVVIEPRDLPLRDESLVKLGDQNQLLKEDFHARGLNQKRHILSVVYLLTEGLDLMESFGTFKMYPALMDLLTPNKQAI